jgi:hypothetical protein
VPTALAPSRGESTEPTTTPPDTTTPALTEALIITCALAWKGNPLSGLDITLDRAQKLVSTARAVHGLEPIVRWKVHTEPAEWTVRWLWAVRVVKALFPTALGLRTLFDRQEDLPAVQDLIHQLDPATSEEIGPLPPRE